MLSYIPTNDNFSYMNLIDQSMLKNKIERFNMKPRRNVCQLFSFCCLLLVYFGLTNSITAQLRVHIDSVITTNYPEVRVVFSVLKNGQVVSSLSPGDIQLFEDLIQRMPFTISCDTVSIGSDVSVLMILDHSGSMIGEPIQDAKDAATVFVNLLKNNDEVAVMEFDSRVQLLLPFTTDKISVVKAIQSIMVGDYTNLWKACVDGLNTISPRTKRKAIVLLTDGFNNINSGNTVDEAINLAKQLGIPFFVIGLGTEIDSIGLTRLASETGGSYFFSPTSKELEQIYVEIARIINYAGRCVLTYQSKLPCLDGQQHTVKLHITSDGLYGEASATFTAPYDARTLFPVVFDVDKNIVIEAGQEKIIPIRLAQLNASQKLSSFEFDVIIDTLMVKIISRQTTSLTMGYNVDIQPIVNGYHIKLSGVNPVSIPGELLLLQFASTKNDNTRKSQLQIQNINVSDACAMISANSTSITVSGKCDRAIKTDSTRVNFTNELFQNSPNPVNPSTSIQFSLAEKRFVTLTLFNSAGQKIKSLINEVMNEGLHSYSFSMPELSSGIYFYRISTERFSQTKQMLVIR